MRANLSNVGSIMLVMIIVLSCLVDVDAMLGGIGDIIDNNVVAGNDLLENHDSERPSGIPTVTPTLSPSIYPSANPSLVPSQIPTMVPSRIPSAGPTLRPSITPTNFPSYVPSSSPSLLPSTNPSSFPTSSPSSMPSTQPIPQPSGSPVDRPSTKPSVNPTVSPIPSMSPSLEPSIAPSKIPSHNPSSFPTSLPSATPTFVPSLVPSTNPSQTPSEVVKTYAFQTDIIIHISNISNTMDDDKARTFGTTTYDHMSESNCASSDRFDVKVKNVEVTKQSIRSGDTLVVTLSTNGTVTSRYSSIHFEPSDNMLRCFETENYLDFNGRLHGALFSNENEGNDYENQKSSSIMTILASSAVVLAVILSTFLGVYYNSLRRERLTVELPDGDIFDNHRSYMSDSFHPRSNSSYSTKSFRIIGQANPVASTRGISFPDNEDKFKSSLGQLDMASIGSQESFSSKRSPLSNVTGFQNDEVPTSILIDNQGKGSRKDLTGENSVYVDNIDDDEKSPSIINTPTSDEHSKNVYAKSNYSNSSNPIDVPVKIRSHNRENIGDNVSEMIAELSPGRQRKDVESLIPEEENLSQDKPGSIFSSDLLVESDDDNMPVLSRNLDRCSTPFSESTSSYLFGLNISEEAMLEAKRISKSDRSRK